MDAGTKGAALIRRHSTVVIASLLVFAGLVMTACSAGTADRETSQKIRVVVSVAPQKYFVKQLGRDRFDVEVLIPPGANPATFEPSMRQLTALEDAEVLLTVGHPAFPFEAAWLDQLVAGNPGLRVVSMADSSELIEGDPHVWLSTRAVKLSLNEISDALAEHFPLDARRFEEWQAQFAADIDVLDSDIRAILTESDVEEFVVFHPSWGYFARDYGLKQISIEHEHKEPDANELAHLVEHMRDSDTRVLFVQPQFSSSSADTLAREVGARVEVLDPLAEDWEANLRRAAKAIANSGQ